MRVFLVFVKCFLYLNKWFQLDYLFFLLNIEINYLLTYIAWILIVKFWWCCLAGEYEAVWKKKKLNNFYKTWVYYWEGIRTVPNCSKNVLSLCTELVPFGLILKCGKIFRVVPPSLSYFHDDNFCNNNIWATITFHDFQ